MNAPVHPGDLAPADFAFCLFSIFLVPLAAAGLTLINTGLGRSRSAAHSMMSSLCVLAVAALVYVAWGASFQGLAGQAARVMHFGRADWNWLGAQPIFLRHVALEDSPAALVALFGIFSAGLASMIPLGSGTDRWRISACCLSTVLLVGFTYPLFAHWVWGGGWLAGLGGNFGIGRGMIDGGGSGVIQATGGLTALSIAWIIGPRRGKYSSDGTPAAIPGHNTVLVLLGCILTLGGWLGLNSAGAMLFYGAPLSRAGLIAINTVVSAACAGLATAAITSVRYRKPDASLTANGWVGGLAASSAAAAFVVPAEAAIIGLVAGTLVAFSVEWFELRMEVDDPSGAISAHGTAGLWGLLAAGFFARFPQAANAVSSGASETAAGGGGQVLAQIIGIATLLGFVLPVAYGLNWLLDRVYRQRVGIEGEYQGMDLYELGGGAYPEFITHGEDFSGRR
jgi:ammonium transporter, Amt family